jgi:Carboxypeptidase regulatory-like domain
MNLVRQNFTLASGPQIVCIILILIFSLTVAAQAQQDESKGAAPSTGTLRGRVLTESGQPLSRATVYITTPGSLLRSRIALSDDGGNFQFTGLAASAYSVSASAPAYVEAPREPDSLPPLHRIGEDVTINLLKGGVVSGSVTSATGEPAVAVRVRAILTRDVNGKPPVGPRSPLEKLTDDRGIYRIYGLTPGTYKVSVGGRFGYGYLPTAYDNDVPTYAPSATLDSAAEVAVRAGEETTGVDIRHRGEPGHAVSGVVNGATVSDASTNISLSQIINGLPQTSSLTFPSYGAKSFAFYGVPDGEYDLVAQSFIALGEVVSSEPRRISVKGVDVSGVELDVKALGSISGHVVLEASTAPECANKRRPLLAETLLGVRRSETLTPQAQLAFVNYYSQAAPNQAGDFQLRSLVPGHFDLTARFFAKYWYLRAVSRNAAPLRPATAKTALVTQTDVAKNGINLKFGERVSDLTVTLAAGAASLHGSVKPAAGESVPARLYLHLVPAEKEKAEDVLRFFMTPVAADGTFAIGNLPPGRYWSLARIAAKDEPQSDVRLRTLEEAETRAQIRRAAEAAKAEIEFNPCQNVLGYQVSLKNVPLKN